MFSVNHYSDDVFNFDIFQVLKKYENDAGRYLICGTNAYKPICRDYVEDAGKLKLLRIISAIIDLNI